MKNQLRLMRKMQFGFAAVVIVVFLASVIAYRSVTAATETEQWSAHTLRILEHIQKLRYAMSTMASGYRDYALSGNTAFLQAAGTNISLVDQERGFLSALTLDNPVQQARLERLGDLVQQVIERGEKFVRLRQSGDTSPPGDVALQAKMDPLGTEIRTIAVAMTDDENRLLATRDVAARRSYHQAKISLLVGSALALLIAAISGWRMPRDYTERVDAEVELRRLNRLYAMLSGINALGVRVRDLHELFTTSCQLAVEAGEFEMSWIGVVDPSGTRIVPSAWAGIDDRTRDTILALFATNEGMVTGHTMAARAIREKSPMVSNDVPSDTGLVLGKLHTANGVRSLVMLPLIVSNKAIGVFVLYSSQAEFFDAPGLALLTEVASNVAFAIDHISKQEQYDRFAYYDPLTGLANRTLFLDRLNQHMQSATSAGHRMAVLLFDLERFKKFNDTLGRPTGDLLLIQVAEWLALRAGSVHVVARMGVDQFAVVLPEVTYEGDVAELLEVMMGAFLVHPFSLKDVEYRVAAKVGVALFPEDGRSPEMLFQNAEAALKKAKAGRDRYLFFAQQMTDSATGTLSIENRLRLALEHGEFVLHYQPKVHLTSGRLTGAEALIRWNDPRTGLVPPARFIPILEETGLIHEVGRWALQQAIGDYRRWLNAGLSAVRISVNVSPLQLRHPKFVAEVEEAVAIAPNASAGLELELTESLIMENVTHSIGTLLAIRALGITIAIDDFGTGFSSLSYLTELPVDTLKIDRSFVVGMTSGARGLTLVSVIINMAHALKLKVVAEGVETEDQLCQLRLLRCDEMQGYLFGKPVPIEVFEKKYLSPALLVANI